MKREIYNRVVHRRRPLLDQMHRIAQRRALRAAEEARRWGCTEDEVKVIWANEYDAALKELKEVHS